MWGARFTCPECGSHRWGTSKLIDKPEHWTGHCHGYIKNQPCKFKWNRSKDDDKYFHEDQEDN